MSRQRRFCYSSTVLLAVLLLGIFTSVGFPQAAYPTRAIEMVVCMPVGGGADVTIRVLAMHLSTELGMPVNIINRPGGNRIPGILSVLKSRADGYTLMGESLSALALQALIEDLPYKAGDYDFGPSLIEGSSVFYISAKSPWKNLHEVIAAARKDPVSFTWTRYGGMAVGDFAITGLLSAAGVDIKKTKPVSMGGAGQGVTSVAGGHVMFGVGGPSAVAPLVQSGNLKVVAANGDRRARIFPDAPYVKELGYNVSITSLYGITAPKGIPKHVVDRLTQAAKKISESPKFIEDVNRIGMEVLFATPEEAHDQFFNSTQGFKALASKYPALLK